MPIPITQRMLTPFLYNFPNWSQTTPFTYQDGQTAAKLLESLITYIDQTLVPYVDGELQQQIAEWTASISALITQLETSMDEFDASVNAKVAHVDSVATAVDANRVAAVAAQTAAEAAAALAEQFASEASGAKDSSMTVIFNNASSAFRTATDAAYVLKSDFNTLADTVNTGRLSISTLDARFDAKADKSTQETVETGRLSATTIDARFDAVIDDAAPSTDSAYSSQYVNTLVNGRMIWGNFADLPAPASVKPGTQFACLDVPELYLSDGTQWRVIGAGGNEIGYAESASGNLVNNPNTAPVDIPGLTTTFIVGKRPICVSVSAQMTVSVTTSVAYLRILLDGTQIGLLKYISGYADIWETHSWSRAIHGLAQGSEHTVSVQIARDPAGTGIARIAADSTNPNSVKVVTV